MRRTRSLSPEEAKLWRSAMKDVVPLRAQPPVPPDPAPLPVAVPAILPPAPPGPIAAPPAMRKPNGLDGQTLRQLAKGERLVEATIDLHGMTLDLAYATLRRFIETQARAGRRCLLVITGKGGPDRPGRLKQEVPQWLATWQPPVLAVVPAIPRHGGSGAFYVLLQRRR